MANRLPPLCGSSTRDPHPWGESPGCSCTPTDPTTRADALLAVRATIRAVLGGDVPEIPNERSPK